ncbi:T-cell surface antigen CD2 isoform X2 [Dermochelys coriacea]|uniref:T-cell surface antigen CD2 isoform X2 n=1 Tax=Dermochelys coriacea TaxID=27794 RepID=UPI001CA8AE1D|nr:T-cell surface antigen CD2 isoform X2 [Dermochelys coriacea]
MQGQFGDTIWKMNFRGTFLAKCLVVLFSCVKGSADEAHKTYGVLGGSVFLNIIGFKVEKQHEITWLKNASFLVKVKNSTMKYYREKEKYKMFHNGTLQIDHLVEEDRGNYKVNVYDKGKLQIEKNLNLSFQEIVSKPEIKWICLQNSIKVTCEVNQTNQTTFHLYQNNKELNLNPHIDANGIWKIEYSFKNSIAKFQCEVKNDVSKKTADQEIKCSDEETPMKIRQMGDELKYRELPQPPVHAPQKQAHQQQRLPPQSQTQYQEGLPRPKPRTQQKSPSHMKERP